MQHQYNTRPREPRVGAFDSEDLEIEEEELEVNSRKRPRKRYNFND